MKGITTLANAVADSPTKVRVITSILQNVARSYLNIVFFFTGFLQYHPVSFQNLFRVQFKRTINSLQKQK